MRVKGHLLSVLIGIVMCGPRTCGSETPSGPPTSGIELVLSVESEPGQSAAARDDDLKAAAEALWHRLLDLEMPFSLEPQANGNLVVRVPSLPAAELAQIKADLTRTGFIEMRLVHPDQPENSSPSTPPEGYDELVLSHEADEGSTSEKFWVKRAPELTGAMLEVARVFSDEFGSHQVSLTFTAAGRKRFAEVTRLLAEAARRTGQPRRLAIVIDGEMYSAPTVLEEVTGGSAVISGTFTEREALELANVLNDPMQLRLEIVEERKFSSAKASAPTEAQP